MDYQVEITERIKLPLFYQSKTGDFLLAHGDCFKLLNEFDFKFDMIFADPPISSPMAAYRCRAERWCVWTRARGTRAYRKPT